MNVACPLCRSDDTFSLQTTQPLAETDDLAITKFIAAGEVLRFVACPTCGLIFRSPRPTPEQVTHYYRDILPPKESATMQLLGVSQQLADARNDLRYALLFDELSPLLKRAPGHIIDIGGSDGRSLVPWQTAGWTTTLIDPGATQRALPNRDIRALGSVDEATRAALEPATVITSYHCIEHMLDIDDWITESKRLSTADTVWVIEVPFEVIYIQKLMQKRPLDRTNIHNEHLNFFTPRSLTALALRMGLEPVSVKIVVTPFWHGPSVSLRMVARAASRSGQAATIKRSSPRRFRARLALSLPIWRRVAGLMFRYTRMMHPEWG